MKRLFDIVVTLLASLAWIPVLIAAAVAIAILDGLPVLYVSRRRVFRDRSIRLVKFRTMRRDAERVANRSTVPEEGTRFLNIPPESPLYTPVGRVLERCCFTELPQLFHVLAGQMSLVGNRPLPEDVIAALKAEFPNVEDRFSSPSGLTGPIQLAGRERLSDAQRLRIEIAYCRAALSSYSMWLDLQILLYTVMLGARLSRPFTAAEVERFLSRFDRSPGAMPARDLSPSDGPGPV